MVMCNDCGHLIPETNLAIHHATACGARARRPDNLGVRQGRSWSTPTRPARHAPEHSITAEPSVISNTREYNNNAGAPKDDGNSPVDMTNNVVDLTCPEPQEWPCPRCTLLNPPSCSKCNACSYHNPDMVRPADPTRRERLVMSDFGTPPPLSRNGSSPLTSPATSGALLGGFLGAANAYMGGRSVGSGALGGAITGFAGGALVGEVLRDNNSNNMSVASARSDAAMGIPPYPSMQSTANRNSGRTQPRQSFRVVRHQHNEANGSFTNTLYTNSGSATTQSADDGGNDPLLNFLNNNDAGVIHNAGGDGNDQFLNLLMQSLLSNGQGRAGVDNMSYEELLHAFGDGTENLGADESTIQNLPTAVLKNPSSELPHDQRQCCICLEDFKGKDTRKTLQCLHGFHKDCVDKWLRSNGSCPVCKHKVSS